MSNGNAAAHFVDRHRQEGRGEKTAFLEGEMEAGRMRPCDARLLLLSVYSTVVGVATEVEVLRAVGIEPTLRSTTVRRRELLTFLHRALVSDG